MFGLTEEKRSDITLYVAILALVVSFVIGIFTINHNSIISTIETDQTELERVSTQLQFNQTNMNKDLHDLQFEIHEITNYKTTIHGEADHITLKSYHFQLREDSNIEYIIMKGNLSTSFQIISPHITIFSIKIRNYSKPWDVFKEGYAEYTEFQFVNRLEAIPVDTGIQVLDVHYPIACMMYPIDYVIPEPGRFEHFLLGRITFEVTLVDHQTEEELVKVFTSEVVGRIEMPEESL